MSDPLAALADQLRALKESFDESTARTALASKAASLSPEQRARLEQLVFGAPPTPPRITGDIIGADKVAGDKLAGDKQQGTVSLSDGARASAAVGVNQGTIQLFFGVAAPPDAKALLDSYLDSVVREHDRLRLGKLLGKEQSGREQKLMPAISLRAVYTSLATNGWFTGEAFALDRDALIAALDAADPRQVPPDLLRLPLFDEPPEMAARDSFRAAGIAGAGSLAQEWMAARRALEQAPDGTLRGHWLRVETPIKAMQAVARLVLLGAPGSGKSTVLRHLCVLLAESLLGWHDDRQALPILLPLRTLAGRIEHERASPATVRAALCDELRALGIAQPDALLDAALDRDAALLLFDGLDEVPLERVAGITADRATTLRAVRDFVQLHARARALLTCRTRAFDERERTTLGWPVETLAPFTTAQIRAFVDVWYNELVAKNQLTPEQKERLAQALLVAATDPLRPRLREMAQTPLLLTLMALVLYTRRELPRDRPQLYERMLDLLLGQWDKLRDGETLADAIGLPDWTADRILPLLDRLSYEAHADARSQDGRGSLQRGAVYAALLDFFKQARVLQPGDKADRCLDYLNRRSGLLVPDNAQDSYTFAHLTLQEHCAGRQIALNSDDPMALIRVHRDDDRWREPILLGMGLVHPSILNSVLVDLIDPEEDSSPKPPPRWYRDLILAAEIGKDRDWDTLRTRPLIKVDRLQRDLRAGLVALLADKSQPLPVAERVRAGFLLGELGDPRYPVTPAQWRDAIERAWAGNTSGYFCRVEPGQYIIGSADDDSDARDDEKPQHIIAIEQPFLIARYPTTNDQWQMWVNNGGRPSQFADDTDLNGRNQPTVIISWQMANAFCAWLSQQAGATIRLPSEYEWEAAARGGDARRYPWGDSWKDDCAATAEDLETRGGRWSVPVGCYPAGVAPNGALDMAGNVWEWTSDPWRSYPGAEKVFTEEDWRVLRGGGFNSTNVRCGARDWDLVDDRYNRGFRLMVAPRLAHTF